MLHQIFLKGITLQTSNARPASRRDSRACLRDYHYSSLDVRCKRRHLYTGAQCDAACGSMLRIEDCGIKYERHIAMWKLKHDVAIKIICARMPFCNAGKRKCGQRSLPMRQ
jgi:hypothetical protein